MHRRQDVARLEVEVIAGSVEVGRHRRDVVAPVLPAIRLRTALMPAILAIAYHSLVGSSVPVSNASSRIGWGCELRIDARRAEEQQLGDIAAVRRLDDVRLDHEVVVQEVRRDRCRWPGSRRPSPPPGTPHRGACQRTTPAPPPGRSGRALRASGGQHLVHPSFGEPPNERGPDHSAMARRRRRSCRPDRARTRSAPSQTHPWRSVRCCMTSRSFSAPSRGRARGPACRGSSRVSALALAGSPISRSTSVGRK